MLQVDIVTPARVAWKGEAVEVQLPGDQGEMGILDGHATLLAVTRAGVVRLFIEGGQVETMVVGPGFVEVTPLGVTLLVDGVEAAESVDKDQAARDLESAEKALAHEEHGSEAWQQAEYGAAMARARLAV